MSKHRKHDECCYPMYGSYGYGMGGGTDCGEGIRWFYALLLLIVIVLQFGRNYKKDGYDKDGDSCGSYVVSDRHDGDLIDSSVLFIIVVFLLVLCAGCWFGNRNY